MLYYLLFYFFLNSIYILYYFLEPTPISSVGVKEREEEDGANDRSLVSYGTNVLDIHRCEDATLRQLK